MKKNRSLWQQLSRVLLLRREYMRCRRALLNTYDTLEKFINNTDFHYKFYKLLFIRYRSLKKQLAAELIHLDEKYIG